MSALEILAVYEVAGQNMMIQGETRMGKANPSPRSAISFSVNFDAMTLSNFVKEYQQVYLQAAFMKKSDYDAGAFERMILSEMDTIGFINYGCPETGGSMGIDDDGTLTTTSASGNTTKTQETSSSSSSSTSVTKGGTVSSGGEGGSSGGGK